MGDTDGSEGICAILKKGCFGDSDKEGSLVNNDYKSWLTWIVSLLNVILVQYYHIVISFALIYYYLHRFHEDTVNDIAANFHKNNIDMLAFVVKKLVNDKKYNEFTNDSAKVLYYLLLPLGSLFLLDQLHPSELISWNYLFTAMLTGLSIAFSNYAQVYWQRVTKQVEMTSNRKYTTGDYVQIGKEYKGEVVKVGNTEIVLKEELDDNESKELKCKFKFTYIPVGYIYDNIVSTYDQHGTLSAVYKPVEASDGDNRLPSNKKGGRSSSRSRDKDIDKESSINEPSTPSGSPRGSQNVVTDFKNLENYKKFSNIYEIIKDDITKLYGRIENFRNKYKLYILSAFGVIVILNIYGSYTGSSPSHA